MERDQGRDANARPKHAVIVSHPEADSFTMSVARAYCAAVEAEGQSAILRDLYRMDFDPVLKASERASASPSSDVREELEVIQGSGAFVLIYPIWFGTPPAMIKGYVERVLGAGFSPRLLGEQLGNPSHPLLGGKHLLSFSSSGATREWLEDQGAWVSLQSVFDGYLARAFWMDTPEHVHFGAIVDGVGKAMVDDNLKTVRETARRMCDQLRRDRAA